MKSTNVKVTLKDFPKGTVMPKKPRSAFILFQAENFKKVREQNPDLKMAQVTTKSAADWGTLSKSKKAKYEKQAIADKQRHQKEVHQLETKGFFVNKDGVKSCELKKKRSRADMKLAKEKLQKSKEAEKVRKQKMNDLKKKKMAKAKLSSEKEKAKMLTLRKNKRNELSRLKAASLREKA